MASFFDRIASARVFQKGNRIVDGKYIFAVSAHRAMPKGDGAGEAYNGNTFVAEFIVVQSEPVAGMYAVGGEPCWPTDPGAKLVEPNAVGSTCSFVCVLADGKNGDSAAGNLKQYMCALGGITPAYFDGEIIKWKARMMAPGAAPEPNPFSAMCDAVCTPEQPMRGALVACDTRWSKTKTGNNIGKRGCFPNFMHIPMRSENEEECARLFAERLARRAAIESGLLIQYPTIVSPEAVAQQLEYIRSAKAAEAAKAGQVRAA
jgi:hypothetical protein